MALIRTGSTSSQKPAPTESTRFDISRVPFRTAQELASEPAKEDSIFAIAVALHTLTSNTSQQTSNWQLNALLHSHRNISQGGRHKS